MLERQYVWKIISVFQILAVHCAALRLNLALLLNALYSSLLLLFLRARVQPTLDPYAEAFL